MVGALVSAVRGSLNLCCTLCRPKPVACLNERDGHSQVAPLVGSESRYSIVQLLHLLLLIREEYIEDNFVIGLFDKMFVQLLYCQCKHAMLLNAWLLSCYDL